MSKTQEITEASLIQRNESKFLASALGEEIVMMNTDNGAYIGVNSVGSDIWNLLSEPIQTDRLVDEVGKMYDIDTEELKTEINNFLQRMLKHDMIIVTG
ncbi:PqqD family protein [Mucilaginibacter sp. UYCu711]|uniref:PqqD family protein n=1 Tax=Mucilaginibacter sp. UYCu711 TaxID=3156339 RepID=UPI003D23C1C8